LPAELAANRNHQLEARKVVTALALENVLGASEEFI